MSFCSQILGVSVYRLCQCWCGGRVSKPGNRFIKGHENRGRKHTSGTHAKMSESLSGENHPSYGKPKSEETKRKTSEKMSGENHPMFGKHQTGESKQKNRESNLGKNRSDETKRKIGESKSGENNPNWRGGISSEPYCFKFDEPKKEKTREDFSYTCFWCGITQEEFMEKQRSMGKRPQKLCIHHVDYDKNQGCDGIKWKLVPLCSSCHGKINKNNKKEMEKFFIEKLYFREFSTMCQNSTVLFR